MVTPLGGFWVQVSIIYLLDFTAHQHKKGHIVPTYWNFYNGVGEER